jgi:CubicO group peptidase (beta-lactamase class C family)
MTTLLSPLHPYQSSQITMRPLSALLLPTLGAATTLPCVPEGPVVPKPSLSTLSCAPVLDEAVANLSAALDAALSGTINAGWATENASFSIALVSKDQPEPGVPLWEYHHLAEANTQGTTELTRDSEYLIGSISKLLSSYIMLMAGVDVDAPVIEYIPELAEPGSLIHWENVTLRMLASHLSGAPANCKPVSRLLHCG